MIFTVAIILFIFLAFLVHRVTGLQNLHRPLTAYFLYTSVFLLGGVMVSPLYVSRGLVISNTTSWWILYGTAASIMTALAFYLIFVKLLNGFKYKGFCRSIAPRTIAASDGLLITVWGIGVLLVIVHLFTSGFNPFSGANLESERVSSREGVGVLVLASRWFITYPTVMMAAKYSRWPLFLLLFFALSVFVVSLFGGRAFPLVLVVSIVYIWVRKNNRFIFTKLALLGMLAFTSIAVLGTLRQGVDDQVLPRITSRLTWRPFVTVLNTERILQSPNIQLEPLLGRALVTEFVVVLPGHQPGIGQVLKERLDLDFEGGGITPSILGVGAADFGILGLLTYPVLTGALIGLFTLVSCSRVISTRELGFWTMVSLAVWGMAIMGPAPPLLYGVMPLLLLHFFLTRFLSFAHN